MSEDTPKYETGFKLNRIHLSLWPKGSLFSGKRTGPLGQSACRNPTLMNLEIADAELLAAEWERTLGTFEQEGARSIRAALREYEEWILQEDLCHAED
jgi:hypothetical protein